MLINITDQRQIEKNKVLREDSEVNRNNKTLKR